MDASQQLGDLIQRCQQGDHAAFEVVFREFQPRLAYYFQRLNHGRQGTDDLIQEVWIKVIRKIRTLKDPQAFVAWLYRIARNELFTRTRQRKQVAPMPDEPMVTDALPGDRLLLEENVEQVHAALDRLKPHHQEILILHFMEQMSHAQIATVLKCSENTVRSRFFYAKQTLRKELERYHG